MICTEFFQSFSGLLWGVAWLQYMSRYCRFETFSHTLAVAYYSKVKCVARWRYWGNCFLIGYAQSHCFAEKKALWMLSTEWQLFPPACLEVCAHRANLCIGFFSPTYGSALLGTSSGSIWSLSSSSTSILILCGNGFITLKSLEKVWKISGKSLFPYKLPEIISQWQILAPSICF